MQHFNAYQYDFDAIVDKHGLSAGLEFLYYKQVEDGFVDPRQLTVNTTYTYTSPQYQVDFKILINRLRDSYASKVSNQDVSLKKCCVLCIENISRLGQDKKQFVTLLLCGQTYVLSLTPFPSFIKHFVLSQLEHTPMRMDAQTLASMILLQRMLGSQDSIFCNSDHPKTGASIIDHHHMQIIGYSDLPIGQAKAEYVCVIESGLAPVLMEQLDFPARAIRFSSDNSDALQRISGDFLVFWKALEKGNTCNAWARQVDGMFEITLILRQPTLETTASLHRYKTEGVGIVEMCGFGIFPSPKQEVTAILREIEDKGESILCDLLICHAPENKNYCALFQEAIA